jgi:hypothetical protein
VPLRAKAISAAAPTTVMTRDAIHERRNSILAHRDRSDSASRLIRMQISCCQKTPVIVRCRGAKVKRF